MAVKKIVSTGFWTDDKVVDLFTPEDKYFFLYLLTNPHSTQLGIYHLSPKIAAFEMGYSVDTVMGLIDRFQNNYKIVKWNKSTQEIAIKNYLKHSIVKGGKPVADLLKKELSQVKDKELVGYIFESLKDCPNLNLTVEQFIIDNTSILDKKKNDYDNDNDNSSTNRGTNRTQYNPIVSAQNTLGLLSLSEYQAQLFISLYDEVGEAIYQKALEKTARQNIKAISYVEKVAREIAAGNDYDEKPKGAGAIDWSKV